MTIVARLSNGATWALGQEGKIFFYEFTEDDFEEFADGGWEDLSEGRCIGLYQNGEYCEVNGGPSNGFAPEPEIVPAADPELEPPPGYIWVWAYGGYAHLLPTRPAGQDEKPRPVDPALCGAERLGLSQGFTIGENTAGPCPCCLVALERKEGK